MSRRGMAFALTTFLLSSLLTLTAQNNKQREQARQKEEAGNYLKKWASEEVPYIIDPQEQAAFNKLKTDEEREQFIDCLLYTSPSPRDRQKSRMPSSA